MNKLPLATIPGTEVRMLRAATIDQEFQITVALPYDYHNHPEKSYPVIYVLDGNWYFSMVVDMVRIMNTRMSFCDEMPDAIIVGIGYPSGESLEDLRVRINHRRFRDLRPTRNTDMEAWMHQVYPTDEIIESGHAAEFHDFIKNELLPMIESEYRADPTDRSLLGHSLGGICALDLVFRYPSLFQRYVVVSPASNPAADKLFTESTVSLPVCMYLAAGELELAGDAEFNESYYLISKVLKQRLVGNAPLVEHIFPNAKHCAVVTPAFHAGLLAVMGLPTPPNTATAKIDPD